MLKRLLFTLAFVVLAAPAALAADTLQMDCNAIYPASNFHTQGAENFAEKVKEYTDGSVLITVHSGGSLGFKGPELLKAIKDGTLPMSDILMGVVSGSDEIFGLTTIPMLVNSYDEAMEFYQTAKPYYDKACERWNQKLLYAAPWPPSGLHTKNPVEKVEDLSGLKIRTYDKNGAEFLKRAGASPQSLPWGEVYTALSTGLIEAVLTSATSGQDGKFWEVLNHFTEANYSYPLNMMTINLDYWNALTPEQQEAVLKAAAETEQEQWAASEQSVVDSTAALAENGMVVSEMTPELAESLKKIAGEMREEMKAQSGEDFNAVLDAFSK
ncbi:ABC transporter substrate-binding protein [Oceanidesulfovibrio indonesiensis]|uniref:ABC transporter substrate-binding protein n=1 Tax=Oceanidesulfovibrio indonesiensis TaxID=54767 RepID=A0A7M3MGW8_9BACT|nr:TRAP transporter substrate-binding protein [Oceanidesulfovibrio indonesiensis]TVM18489.1 ABC transporter substrate-binding protein [Oceanidesulfovibrio indonesiensis]